MVETDTVYSLHFQQHFKVRGLLKHDYAPDGIIRWFIYLINDMSCHKQYTGSTNDIKKRWANHKSDCNISLKADRCKKLQPSDIAKKTGLCRHFLKGCKGNLNMEKSNLTIL